MYVGICLCAGGGRGSSAKGMWMQDSRVCVSSCR
jgi:hypothetical protein